LLAALFLTGAVFTAWDALSQSNFLTSPQSKAAAGWLVTGLIFLSLGVRGWKAYRRKAKALRSTPVTKTWS